MIDLRVRPGSDAAVFGPNGETSPLDLLDVTLHCPDLHEPDPWPLYDWLREEAPLYRDANGLWHVSRYDDIVAVARDPATFTSVRGNRPLLPNDESFIHLDGDPHRKRRGVIRAFFAPPAIAKLETHVRDAVDALIDEVIEQGHCDFVRDISAPLPTRIICEMTGVPREHHDLVRSALDVFVRGGNGPTWVTDEVNEAFLTFGALHMEIADERRASPKDDLLSLWMNTPVDGELMTDDQTLWEHTMMLVGGSETSRNAISGGVLELARLTDQRAWLAAHPEDLATAAEESIRWVTPFVSMSRTTTHDAEFLGATIPEGDTVVMLYPPASRDPRKFPDPHRFDVRRVFTHRTIAFGTCPHVCLGEHLARLEVKVLLERLIARMPDWRVDGLPTWSQSCFVRGLTHLPLSFTPGERVRR